MCNFFSFVTEPEGHGGKRYYSDWKARKLYDLGAKCDSHSTICQIFKLKEDKCNKYEYNPLTKVFVIEQINSTVDDRVQAEEWVTSLDWKRIVEPLNVKPIINPLLDLPKVEHITDEHIQLLKQWVLVWDSIMVSFRDPALTSVGSLVLDSIRASVGDSVGNLVWDSIWCSAGDSIWHSVGINPIWNIIGDSFGYSACSSIEMYILSFFDKHVYDIVPIVKLWEMGMVPSFDSKTWRLHSGKGADVIYEWQPLEVQNG